MLFYNLCIYQEEMKDLNKKELIELAKNNGKKPNPKSRLGWMLVLFTRPNREEYDQKFHELIIKLAPNWFKSK